MHFVIALTQHRVLGYVFAPYLVRKNADKDYLEIYDRVTEHSLKTYEQLLTPEQVQIVMTIEYYNNQNLFKLYSKKKKQTAREFLEKIPEDLFEDHVRPYVEKQIVKCLQLMEFNPQAIYHKILQDKIYLSDEVELVNQDCETIFNFNRNEDGIQYKLTIRREDNELGLLGKEILIFSNNPCCVSIGNKLYFFKEIDAKKLLPFLDKEYISIPRQAEKKYLQTFVRSAVAKYKVRAEGFKIKEVLTPPLPIVSLETNLQSQIVLVLKFVYNKSSIYYASRPSGKKVTCEFVGDDVEFVSVTRNTESENGIISKLLTFGLVNKEGPYFEPIDKKGNKNGIYGAITWLNYNKQLLKENGIDVARGNLEKDYYTDNFDIKVEVSEKDNDWFDIMANVVFEGFSIPFVEFKEHIVQGTREFVLPNNKVMILPEEWFESYSDLLKFSKMEGENNALKLNKQHFSILQNSVSRVSEDFRDNLKLLLQSTKEDMQPQPKEVKAKLRAYQHEGYNWMLKLYKNSFGGCLADDMGLGKTLQTLTLLQYVINDNRTEGPEPNYVTEGVQLDLFSAAQPTTINASIKATLIIVPTSLIHNWVNEIQKFVPGVKVRVYSGPNRGKLEESIEGVDMVITSYGILRNDLLQFEKIPFLYTVLDESQVIKNPGSKTYAAVMSLKTDFKMVLTGTPIENSLSDLWAQFNFLNPGLLGSLNFFQSEFQYPIEKHQDEAKRERLKQLISPFMLRRAKSQVAKELPPLTEQIVYCDLNEVQASIYEREKSKARKLVLENINRMGLKRATMQILQSLMRLRQIANHPVLSDEEYIAGSGKFDEITRSLSSLYCEGHKALVFSSFVKHLDLVAEWLDSNNYKYVMLTGETQKREEVVEEFQTNSECSFFLVSLKAGGVGLNLTAASYVLMLDPWWNPAAEKQAINRAHRIGQDKHVNVYRFITQDTLEEKILKLQAKKNELADIFVNENAFKNITEEEIMELFD